MKMMKKLALFLVLGTLICLPTFSYASKNLGADVVFDVNPKSVPTSGDRTVTITFQATIYEPQFSQYCGSGFDNNFRWLVATDQDTLKKSDGTPFAGSTVIDKTQPSKTYDLGGKAVVPLLSGIPTLQIHAIVQCDGGLFATVVQSADVPVTNAGAEGTIWACLAADGKYACSPGNKKDLSDVPNNACSGKTAVQIDSTKCGSTSGGGSSKYSCNSNGQCVADPSGSFGDSTCGYTCGTTGATSTKKYSFSIDNPLNGGPNNIFDIINIATTWLLNISIPLAVLFILYAGFLMLTAGGTPGKFDRGKKILINVVIGLAVIFIGRGFITLIYSILELGGSSSTPPTTQSP